MPILRNPFTPSEIASLPNDFFGRSAERAELETALLTGSAAIQGAIGIGKSSLLAQTRLQFEGFASVHRASSVIVTCHKDIRSIDQMAQAVLEELVDIDETHRSFKFRLGTLFESESREVVRNFTDGRHLAALQRLLSRASLKSVLRDEEMLLIALDEVDKCPVSVAQLIRAVTNHAQQNGIKNIRFLLAGVAPYYTKMVEEDPGIARFVYRVISLEPMSDEDATDLLETKLEQVVNEPGIDGEFTIEPEVIPRVRSLSGGHPHLLQLLGSHLVEQENYDPDGIIDSKNLTGALNKICYEDRGQVYDSTLHMLHVEDRLDDLSKLFGIAGHQFPTRINREAAADAIGADALRWLVDHNILAIADSRNYGLADEFLKIRLILDREDSRENRLMLESSILNQVDVENILDEGVKRDELGEEFDVHRIAYADDQPYLGGAEDDE